MKLGGRLDSSGRGAKVAGAALATLLCAGCKSMPTGKQIGDGFADGFQIVGKAFEGVGDALRSEEKPAEASQAEASSATAAADANATSEASAEAAREAGSARTEPATPSDDGKKKEKASGGSGNAQLAWVEDLRDRDGKDGSTDDDVKMLDRAMCRFAGGRPDDAFAMLFDARGKLIKQYPSTFDAYVGAPSTWVTDDRSSAFRGADYEHLMLTAMLSVTDFLARKGEAYAWAERFSQMQTEMLESGYGIEESKYDPRKSYQRLALGAYLAGVIREDELRPDSALVSYKLASEWMPGCRTAAEAVARASGDKRDPPGHGSVHVLYFAGKAPKLEQGKADARTEAVLALLKLIVLLQGKDVGPLFQDAVPVPKVAVEKKPVASLGVRVAGTAIEACTETLLDVNQVASAQIEANRTMVMVRAITRRSVKGGLIHVGVDEATDGQGAGQQGVTQLAGGLANALWTATEKADTRSWRSLPGQIQVARLAVPEGEHTLDFGAAGSTRVVVSSGYATMVVVVHFDTSRPAAIVVDQRSQPVAAQPVEAAEKK